MTNFKRFFVLSLALVLAGQGCLFGGGEPEAAPGAMDGDSKAGGGGAMAGGCSHPYMPFTPGSSITYRSSGSGESSTYTQTVSSNSGGGVTLTYTFPDHDLSLDYDLNCTRDGIFAEGFLDFSSLRSGVGIQTETRSSSGPFLPDGLDVGSTWENHFDMHVTYTDPNFPIPESDQTMDMTRRAVRRESITVPAGTFDALVVEATFNFVNSSFPTGPLSFSQTEYWVEGVGLVKTEGADPGGGSTVTEAIAIER